LSNYTKSTNFATKDNLSPGNPLKIVKGTEIDTEFNNIQIAVATKTDGAASSTDNAIARFDSTTGKIIQNSAVTIDDTTGDIVGTATQGVFNTVSTTVNAFGAATAVNIGAATGTATVNNTTLAAKAITASTTLAVTGTSTLTGAVTATAGVTGPITSSSATITGGSISGITDLAVADGGTGASTAAGGLNNLLPSQTGNANKYLQTDGTNASWDAVSLSTADITGTLPVANGGTGVTSSTGTGNVVLSNSPTLVTPALGTPSALVGTNITGTASGLTAGNVTTNANLTGAITSTGNATSLGSFSSANLLAALTDETGTGANVFATSPTLVTPILGTPTSATLTNATGLPLSTGVTGTLPVANGGTGTTTPSIVAGSNITVTGTWPNQTIAASAGGSGTVTSVAATVPSVFSVSGSPITTSGTLAMTYSGTALPVANGGTGQTSYTDGQLLIGNSTGNTLTKATLTAGTNVTITNSAGAITIAASGGGTPAGVNTQIQYNNSGAFGASANLTFDGSTLTTIGGSAGNVGAYTAILKNSDNANSGSIQLGGATYGALIYRDSAGANSELIFTNSHAGNKGFKFFTGSNIQGTTQLAAIGATGCIAVGTATPSTDGSGITFPATQSASSDANTLDDYEEGTWTPNIGGNATYTGRWGTYTKVGNIVTLQFNIGIDVLGTGSTTNISGLPFAINNPTYANDVSGCLTYFASIATSVYSLCLRGGSGSSSLFFSGTTASTTSINNSVTVFANSTSIQGSITYQTTT